MLLNNLRKMLRNFMFNQEYIYDESGFVVSISQQPKKGIQWIFRILDM
jgi:hypothetical protein